MKASKPSQPASTSNPAPQNQPMDQQNASAGKQVQINIPVNLPDIASAVKSKKFGK